MTKVLSVAGKYENNAYICPIPDVLLMQEKDIIVYVYTEGTQCGETTHEIRIPIIARPKPSGLYTPEQIDNYSAAMLE